MILSDLEEEEKVRSDRKQAELFPLHAAILANDRERVRSLLANPDIYVNALDDDGNAALHLAAYAYVEAVPLLLTMRPEIDVNLKNKNQSTPLDCLILLDLHRAEARLAAISALLEKPVNINEQNREGNTALLLAIKLLPSAVPLLLRQPGIDVNIANNQGETPLLCAVRYQLSLPRLSALLEKPMKINAQNREGNTALHLAIQLLPTAVPLLLRQPGINLNIANGYGETPLHFAVRYQLSLKLLLAEKEIDVNPDTNSSLTPLHLAMLYNRLEPIMTLLAAGADFHVKDKLNRSLLHLAGQPDILAYFLQFMQAYINDCDIQGRTPLHTAAMNQSPECIRLLVAAGANVNAKDDNGDTALHFAIQGSGSALQALLDADDIDLNAQNDDGQTPLLKAEAESEELAASKILLADPRITVNMPDFAGQLAVEIMGNNFELYLHDIRGNVNEPDLREYPLRLENMGRLQFKSYVGANPSLFSGNAADANFNNTVSRDLRRFSILAAVCDLYIPLVKTRNELGVKSKATGLQIFFYRAPMELLRLVLEALYGVDNKYDLPREFVPTNDVVPDNVKHKSLTNAYFNHLRNEDGKYASRKRVLMSAQTSEPTRAQLMEESHEEECENHTNIKRARI